MNAEKFEDIMPRIRSVDRDTIAAIDDELRKLTLSPTAASGVGAGPDWFVVRVELLSAKDRVFEPPPGRDILVSPQHSFRQLAETINVAFARWDLSHLYAFRLDDGRGHRQLSGRSRFPRGCANEDRKALAGG